VGHCHYTYDLTVYRGDNTGNRLRAFDGLNQGTFPGGLSPDSVAFDGVNVWVSAAPPPVPLADTRLRISETCAILRRLYTMPSMVAEGRERDYQWYIVLYRTVGKNQTRFYCNHPRPVPQTWGNLVFFRDYERFSQGQAWCAAVLPRTYFKPRPA
jgi:hypothetical protein